MKQEDFREVCTELGLLLPETDIERLYQALAKKLKWKQKVGTNNVIKAYFDAYRERFKTDPPRDPTAMKRLEPIVKANGEKKVSEWIWTYLSMRDSFFEMKGYDLDTFRLNLTKIGRYHDTGEMTTRKQAQAAESTQGTMSAIQAYRARQRGIG